jgi:hypothetical protein
MTYAQFVKASRKAQAAYIRDERKRYAKATELFREYSARMSTELGLHPLTLREIWDRQDQLKDMEARIPQTHGDTPTMRMMYDMRQEGAQ